MKKFHNNQEVTEFVNSLDGYEGYIQWSHRPIEKEKDIFIDSKVELNYEDGFIYEAHFCNQKETIIIRQINDIWIADTTEISGVNSVDTELFLSDIVTLPKVKMVQIWHEESDTLCEEMQVKRVKKVFFAGFDKGETK